MNTKHAQFVNEYLTCWNATEAYRRVYPKSSYEAARRNASRLMTNDDVKQEIADRIAENAMSADEVLSLLAEQARATYSKYIKEDGEINIKKLVKDGKAHLIKGVKETKYGKDIEFHDAFSARVQIGKHHKLFVDRTENKTDHTLRVEYGNDGADDQTAETT